MSSLFWLEPLPQHLKRSPDAETTQLAISPTAQENSTSLHAVQNQQRPGAVIQPESKIRTPATMTMARTSSTTYSDPIHRKYCQHAFLPRTIRDWNAVPKEAVEANTLDTFSFMARISCSHPVKHFSTFFPPCRSL